MIDTQLRTRLSAAESDELVKLLANPSVADAQQLRAHLGPEVFQRMRSLALRKAVQLREVGDQANGNVLFVPAMLHNELSIQENGQQAPIWLTARSVAAGNLQYLKLDETGLSDADPRKPVIVSGLMKRYCGELLLTLAQSWTVRTFPYDWRKSLQLAATQLQARIEACFPAGKPVHIVAVGEGGIVARLYIALYSKHWEQRGGRLVTIGTPQLGAPIYLQALVGHLDIVQWADRVDPHYERTAYLELLHSFPSIYQLLPFSDPSHSELLTAKIYGNLTTLRQKHLKSADEVQKLLRTAADPQRMAAVVGYGRQSYADVDLSAFEKTMVEKRVGDTLTLAEMNAIYRSADGDGDIAIRSAELRTAAGEMIPTLYVVASDGPAMGSPALLQALDDLLHEETLNAEKISAIATKHRLKAILAPGQAPAAAPQAPSQSQPDSGQQATRSSSSDSAQSAAEEKLLQAERQRVEQLARRLTRAVNTPETLEDTEQERLLEGLLMRNLTAQREAGPRRSVEIPFDPPTIAIEAIWGDISKIDELTIPKPGAYPGAAAGPTYPVDTIAVGHYLGGTAQSGLSALDRAVSAYMASQTGGDATGSAPHSSNLVEDLLQRGTIRGELSNIFLLPDPRPQGLATRRLLAVAGMGMPGRFGSPELAILVRELCWTLGRLGQKHLVTVLIGAGQNNLGVSEAVEAWVRGIKLAITGAEEAIQLQQITFIEYNPQRLTILDRRLQQLAKELGERRRMFIGHTSLDQNERQQVMAIAKQQLVSELERQLNAMLEEPESRIDQTDSENGSELPAHEQTFLETVKEPSPVRITVEYDGETYRFGALAEEAAVADRQIPLDARIVEQANDRLAKVVDEDEQKQQGEFLAKFLFPEDFRTNLSGGAPIVLTLDATTARIHWELLCLTEQQILGRSPAAATEVEAERQSASDLDLFLGTACGLTRQLRTPFARPPEPTPQNRRLLRVLVVADPAADAHLPGAQEEGNAVADLFELYNLLTTSDNRIEVVRLIGPVEATRVAVLQQIMTRSYDVLHFAGHCIYDAERPRASGWIFSDGERLTANEIQRVDRVPSLVVSNACQSGITPDRADERAAALAPTFAETFFARGVANFVCTAWPVGDREARDFALTLYADLLGLAFAAEKEKPALRTDSRCYRTATPQPFHVAMRNARREIAGAAYDRHSWGAYQHYGNPYVRLFAR